MAVLFQVEVFCVVMLCSVVVGKQRFRGPLHLEDGGSMDLCNIGILPQHNMASKPRRPQPEISQYEFLTVH
jgi:hypothetical protein